MGEIGEGELRAKLRGGERITGVIVVARTVDDALEYTPFLLLSWRRGYYRISRWRGGERRYREFGRLLRLLRDLGWVDGVTVFDAADPKLRRVRAVAHALGVPPAPRGKNGGGVDPAPRGKNGGGVDPAPAEVLGSAPPADGDHDDGAEPAI